MTERDEALATADAMIGAVSSDPFALCPNFGVGKPVNTERREPDGGVTLISTWEHASVAVHVGPGCSGADG